MYRLFDYVLRVFRRASLGKWTRWQGVLAAFLSAAVAVAALSVPFHAAWLTVTGVVVAAVGGVVALLLKLGQTRIENQQEQANTNARLRVPVARVSEISPIKIGVDPAAKAVLDRSNLPDYLARTVDTKLREAIEGAFTDPDAWFVVVSGPSKAGKSRSLFEALRRCDKPSARLQLVAPVDGDAVKFLLKPGEGPSVSDERTVLWLDDIEPFINQGLTLKTLNDWRDARPGRMVAATYGGKGSDRIVDPANTKLESTITDLLKHSCQVMLSPRATTKSNVCARCSGKRNSRPSAATDWSVPGCRTRPGSQTRNGSAPWRESMPRRGGSGLCRLRLGPLRTY